MWDLDLLNLDYELSLQEEIIDFTMMHTIQKLIKKKCTDKIFFVPLSWCRVSFFSQLNEKKNLQYQIYLFPKYVCVNWTTNYQILTLWKSL